MPDYKPAPEQPVRRPARVPWFAAGLGIPLVSVALLGGPPAPESATAGQAAQAAALAGEVSATAAPATVAADPAAAAAGAVAVLPAVEPPPPPGETVRLTVRRGDSLDRLFARHDISRADLARIMQLDLAREHLRLIRPGDTISVRHEMGHVLSLDREISLTEALHVERVEDEGYRAELKARELERRPVVASGTIDSSLFEAAAAAGVSDRLIMNLAGIFAWDIDFVLDIRRGDSFRVLYEELWRDGERLGEGRILAAEFINQGESFKAFYYEDPTGRADYYDPDGRSLRKAFVRAPLSFSRISSNFNPRRRHPKLNTIRAHRGVDYAAPTGTPVKAAGDGKVIFRGRKGGYGNTVILQHGGNITTLYAHLSRFGKPRTGSRVRQGQVIGYVGATGLATGPHLHYEYRVNGVHQNPRTVKLPDAEPLDPAWLPAFREVSAALSRELDAHRPLLASQAPLPSS
ncbi:MAG: peptidase M23 [Gammaproteobacteria bacterium]|nr:MAG: peptidase M23 [Gammaproteobacteria bacterium]